MKKFIGFWLMMSGMIVLYSSCVIALSVRFGIEKGFYLSIVVLCLTWIGIYLFFGIGERK